MSDFPRALYRTAQPFADWNAVGDALRAGKVESVTVADEAELEMRTAEGFGPAAVLISAAALIKPKAKKKE